MEIEHIKRLPRLQALRFQYRAWRLGYEAWRFERKEKARRRQNLRERKERA